MSTSHLMQQRLHTQEKQLENEKEFILQQIDTMQKQLNSLEVEFLHLTRGMFGNQQSCSIIQKEYSNEHIQLDDAKTINTTQVLLTSYGQLPSCTEQMNYEEIDTDEDTAANI